MIFSEAMAEWVRRHYPEAKPIIGTVSFDIEDSFGDYTHTLELTYRELHYPRRGRIGGKWQYGEPYEKTISCILADIDLTRLICEIVEIAAEDLSPAKPAKGDTQ